MFLYSISGNENSSQVSLMKPFGGVEMFNTFYNKSIKNEFQYIYFTLFFVQFFISPILSATKQSVRFELLLVLFYIFLGRCRKLIENFRSYNNYAGSKQFYFFNFSTWIELLLQIKVQFCCDRDLVHSTEEDRIRNESAVIKGSLIEVRSIHGQHRRITQRTKLEQKPPPHQPQVKINRSDNTGKENLSLPKSISDHLTEN